MCFGPAVLRIFCLVSNAATAPRLLGCTSAITHYPFSFWKWRSRFDYRWRARVTRENSSAVASEASRENSRRKGGDTVIRNFVHSRAHAEILALSPNLWNESGKCESDVRSRRVHRFGINSLTWILSLSLVHLFLEERLRSRTPLDRGSTRADFSAKLVKNRSVRVYVYAYENTILPV